LATGAMQQMKSDVTLCPGRPMAATRSQQGGDGHDAW